MKDKKPTAIHRILNKIDSHNFFESLSTKIPSSDLNTLLLELFKERTNDVNAQDLLKSYSINRFVHPADFDPIWMKQLEMDVLKIAKKSLYHPLQLSPVSILGSCSVIAKVNQNKVISALRGTEVVADATNSLALQICELVKSGQLKNDTDLIRFCTSHRHIRAQKFEKEEMVPHFNIFCMVTSGQDRGSYSFEKQAILEHIDTYRKIFNSVLETDITVRLNAAKGYTDHEGLLQRLSDYIQEEIPQVKLLINTEETDNLYYQGLQFTIITNINGEEINIGDGGIVDWSQKLLGSKKERMMISGIGLDMIYYFQNR
ncbi:hypothetical protein P4J13_25840 [Bacillus anthracis]|uniref:hypothetical protein n=1 Tax=Bacillus anthracis TaxID=1392 RepID=UPI002DB55B68|nr:hypothetical protein [Bacillus anthracis]MEB9507352.1 hypothetical protein [Bacillus anthracis]